MACALLAACRDTGVDEFSAKVVAISDGDSITVLRHLMRVRARFSGIGCPAVGQDFGRRAKAAKSEPALSEVVAVRQPGRDRYGVRTQVVMPPSITRV
jgi:endonuclease YncB( thermonuclease family)